MRIELSCRVCITVIVSVFLALFGTGCASAREKGTIQIKPKPLALSRNILIENVVLDKGEKSAEAIVATIKQGRLKVITTTEDIPPRSYKRKDEIIIVLDGEGVSELNGIRDIVSQGHVIVIPRKTTFSFQTRGDKPVILLSILVHDKNMQKTPDKENN